MTRDIDVSIVLTVHREGKYLARTLTSLSDAAAFARAQGILVELVAVQDRADHATTEVLRGADLSAFELIHSIDVDNGSVSRSRNDGCAVATGTYIDVMDGDDLLCHSHVARSFVEARRQGRATILVPKFVFGFGSRYYTVEYFNQDELPAAVTVKCPLYTANIFAHHSLFADNKYTDLPLSQGYAYEDWHFNCNAMALGYRFFAVEGTALFYRQRPDSRNHRADQISTRQIPPSILFKPSVFLRLFAGETRRLSLRHGQAGAPIPRGPKVFNDPTYRDLIARANAIDPAVDFGHYRWDCLGHYSNFVASSIGSAYYRICEIVGDGEFEAVFLLPVDLPDGSIDPVEAAMHDLALHNPTIRILALFDRRLTTNCGIDLLPPSVLPLDLLRLCGSLTAEDRDICCLKLLQTCAPVATIHFGPSPFARSFFARFRRLLSDNRTVFYRGTDRTIDINGFPFTDPIPFEFISEHLGFIDEVIAYDQTTVDADCRRLGGMRGKWRLRSQSVVA